MPKKNGNKDMTKRLQNLVKTRKTKIVISDSASYKPYKRNRNSKDSSGSYSYN